MKKMRVNNLYIVDYIGVYLTLACYVECKGMCEYVLYCSSTIKCKRCFTGGEPDLPTSDVNVQEPDIRREVISRPHDPLLCSNTNLTCRRVCQPIRSVKSNMNTFQLYFLVFRTFVQGFIYLFLISSV